MTVTILIIKVVKMTDLDKLTDGIVLEDLHQQKTHELNNAMMVSLLSVNNVKMVTQLLVMDATLPAKLKLAGTESIMLN